MILLIVESPGKARRLEQLLGPDYLVRATRGHVMDLPRRGLGLKRGDRPRYRVVPSFRKELAALRIEALLASEIWIATDPDREGELIAHHLGGLLATAGKPIRRLLLRELTAEGVDQAMKRDAPIDRNVAEAQMARRTIDRLVGYTVSPHLAAASAGRLTISTGRVQSAALALLAERERSIEEANGHSRLRVRASLDARFSRRVSAISVGSFREEAEAQSIVAGVRASGLRVRETRTEHSGLEPPPPFATHTLIEACSTRFGFGASAIMRAAQALYQGTTSDSGPGDGLITYPRTDSEVLTPRECQTIRREAARHFRTRTPAGASTAAETEAHGAIRPVDVGIHPDQLRARLTPEQYRVYESIWKRTLASEMPDASFETTRLVCDDRTGSVTFEATIRRCTDPGFLACDGDFQGADRPLADPPVAGEWLPIDRVDLERVRPPDAVPYTEGGLVSALRQRGIGRASTYARVIDSLVERGLARRTPEGLHATRLGLWVNRRLEDAFPSLTGVAATAHLESAIDAIANGTASYEDVIETFIEEQLLPVLDRTPSETDRTGSTSRGSASACPVCGLPLVHRSGKFGTFLGCSGFPRCRYSRPVTGDST